MRVLAARLSTYLRRRKLANVQSRRFSAFGTKDPTLEEEAERKIGLMFKVLFAGAATIGAYQLFPYLGDNLIQQSIYLVQVKDPMLKRMGASRLTSFAVDDERIMKIVEMGGVEELLNMLKSAKDDQTRKEALKALDALSHSDEAVGALHHAGAVSIISLTPESFEDVEIKEYQSSLLKRFQELKCDTSS